MTDNEISYREILNKHIEFPFNFPNNLCTGQWQKDEHSAPCRVGWSCRGRYYAGRIHGTEMRRRTENILIQYS